MQPKKPTRHHSKRLSSYLREKDCERIIYSRKRNSKCQLSAAKCGYQRQPSDTAPDYQCPKCGIVYAKFDPSVEIKTRLLRARATGDWTGIAAADVPPEFRADAAAGMVIATTTPMVPGRSVVRVLDVVSAEAAMGMNIFKDILTNAVDVTGGRSGATQSVLRDGRVKVMRELKIEAANLGGDAVIGVQIGFNEFTGGGRSMLFVTAVGTAVVLSQLAH